MRLGLSLQMGAGSGLDSLVAAMFLAGEQGAWYDPSDLTTLFQDSLGVTPVTDVGQPVGMIKDKSGNNRHMIQATASNKPILQVDANNKYYLEFDGVDDFFTCASFDMSASENVTVFAAVTKRDETTAGVVFESSPNISANNYSFSLACPGTASGTNASFGSKGTTVRFSTKTGIGPGTTPYVLIGIADLVVGANSNCELRVNDLSVVSNTASQAASATFGNYTAYVGKNAGGAPLDGYLYSLIVRGSVSSEAQIASAKAYVKDKAGV